MNNSTDLQQFLLAQMERVASGQQGAKEAKAICNYAAQVYNQSNLELKIAAARRRYEGLALIATKFKGGNHE